MENKHIEKNKENNKKASKKTTRMNEIYKTNNGELWYIITKQNKLKLMYKDGRCKI